MLTTNEIIDKVREVYPLAVEYRRYLHQHPEFSTREYQTQAYIQSVLDKYQVAHRTIGTGIIATLGGGEKCIALRADMDALKVQEETGLPYSSLHAGMMHACGHDMHMAMLLGCIIVLKSMEDTLDGTVKCIFQPSEEKRPGGARLLLPEVMREPMPQAIFGQHIYPGLPTGTIGIRSGTFFASSDNILFAIEGKGTHAAMPHMGADPILAAAHLIQFYQTIITKFRDPLIPAILSITSIHGGNANNIIPDRVEVMGTVRTHDNELREHILEIIKLQSPVICALYGCRFIPDMPDNGLPPLVNNIVMTPQVIVNAKNMLGDEQVRELEPLTLGEDFAIYLQKIPGVFWMLGVCPPQKDEMPPLHNMNMDPDENAMFTGIQMLVKNSIEFLKQTISH